MIKTLTSDEAKLLTFRHPSPAIQSQWKPFLAFGLFFTWLAGMGRYWDNPRAEWWQLLGLGSVAYVFALAFILWVLLAPLRPRQWSYRNVLLFITLTAPPALLYAIPVERFMAPDATRAANAWLLGVVAAWRVALLAVFLSRVARLSRGVMVVATLLPLTIIVVTLSILNLEHVVFDLMGGIGPGEASANDTAYGIVILLSMASFLASPLLLIAYVLCITRAWKAAQPGAVVDTPSAPD